MKAIISVHLACLAQSYRFSLIRTILGRKCFLFTPAPKLAMLMFQQDNILKILHRLHISCINTFELLVDMLFQAK